MTGRIKYLTAFLALFLTVFNLPAIAHYPQAKLSPSDANAGDGFGVSVAIDGNTAVVGSYQNDSNGIDCGAAYVYQHSGSNWTQSQKLTASDANTGDQFGRSVAIEGNTIVVGSYIGDSTEPNSGSAYVFTRSGSVWSQWQKLTALDANTEDKFGCSVSIDNNTIVIGAYGDSSDTGSAYVFTRTGSTWNFQQKLTASDAIQGDLFGYSIAIDDNAILIGAHNNDNSDYQDVGSAYIFQRQDATWIEQNILRASDAKPADHFGYSVALDGNYACIGAYECDINKANDAGAAYVFKRTGDNWVEQQKLFDANDPCSGEDFGWSVAIENDTILTGCVNDSLGGKKTGSVFQFALVGPSWVQSDHIFPADANDDDKFGSSLALSGRNIIVGAPYNNSSGSAYVREDVLITDFDGDSDIDFADFAVFAPAWLTAEGTPGFNPICDISNPPDLLINLLDLETLCDDWLLGK